MANSRLCSIPDCGNRHEAKGYCKKHYERFAKGGSPDYRLRAANGEVVVFLNEVAARFGGNECLIWPFHRNPDGYGTITLNGSSKIASRVVCERVNGPPPSDLHDAAHSCGRGHFGCVSPQHLSWKTREENAADREAHGRTARGVRNGQAKLSDEQVMAIRSSVGITQDALAKAYGVTQSHISKLRNHRYPLRVEASV